MCVDPEGRDLTAGDEGNGDSGGALVVRELQKTQLVRQHIFFNKFLRIINIFLD